MWLLLWGGGTQASRLFPQRLSHPLPALPTSGLSTCCPFAWSCSPALPTAAQLHPLLHHRFREPFPDRHLKRLPHRSHHPAYWLQSLPHFAWSYFCGLSGRNASTARTQDSVCGSLHCGWGWEKRGRKGLPLQRSKQPAGPTQGWAARSSAAPPAHLRGLGRPVGHGDGHLVLRVTGREKASLWPPRPAPQRPHCPPAAGLHAHSLAGLLAHPDAGLPLAQALAQLRVAVD